VVVLGLFLDWLFPAYLLTVTLSLAERIVIGALLIAAGGWLVIAANLDFRAAGTHPEPWKPATAIVTGGIFSWLRNPMYVGGTLILAGLSILLASDWMLVMTIVFVPVIHFGVVRREERYLEAKFGETYLSYKAKVPRYGWPF
jgi:protein-S-isoprenylcysteine O-methyltransferase Ste14